MPKLGVTSKIVLTACLACGLLTGCGSRASCQSGARYGTQCYDEDGVRTRGSDERSEEPEPKPIEPDYVRE